MNYIKLMLISMVPVIELRGAIPLGIAMGLKPLYVYMSCLIGSSLVSIPVVLIFRQVIEFFRHRKYFNIVIRWVDTKIESRAKKLKTASILGLIVFVGVPLPTRGSWSASALASIFKMRIKDTLFGIFIGNAIAGAIILGVSLHLSEGSTEMIIASVLLVLVGTIAYMYKKRKKKKKIVKKETLYFKRRFTGGDMSKKVRKAIIPAAGLGTRFLPATKVQAKEMLPIVDKPTLQYIIEEAIASGIEEILIVTGRNKKSIEDHFDRYIELELELEQKNKKEMLQMVQNISNMVNIHYIRQKEPKGLGHAVHCAKNFIGDEPFAVLLGDDIVDANIPCLKQMINAYDEYKTTILGVQEVAKENVNKYGILDVKHIEDRIYKVKEMVEKPEVEEAPSNIAILGRYIITPEIFNILENQEPGKGGEIQLTDALHTLATKEAVYAYKFEGRRYDVGNKLGFLEATVDFALKRPELRDDFIEFLKTKSDSIEI